MSVQITFISKFSQGHSTDLKKSLSVPRETYCGLERLCQQKFARKSAPGRKKNAMSPAMILSRKIRACSRMARLEKSKVRKTELKKTVTKKETTINTPIKSSLNTTEVNTPTKGEVNKQIFNSLTKAIADANLPGEDYLEFVSALQAMKGIDLQESVKMQTVLATLSTKGLTIQKIIFTT